MDTCVFCGLEFPLVDLQLFHHFEVPYRQCCCGSRICQTCAQRMLASYKWGSITCQTCNICDLCWCKSGKPLAAFKFAVLEARFPRCCICDAHRICTRCSPDKSSPCVAGCKKFICNSCISMSQGRRGKVGRRRDYTADARRKVFKELGIRFVDKVSKRWICKSCRTELPAHPANVLQDTLLGEVMCDPLLRLIGRYWGYHFSADLSCLG
jgi:hypothetical protein